MEPTQEDIDAGIELIRQLSERLGPRPPCSEQEDAAAELIRDRLGQEATIERFASTRSFGPSYLAVFGLALSAALLERRSRVAGSAAGVCAAALAIGESRFASKTPLALLKGDTSQNVMDAIMPAGDLKRTVVLVSHMDSSRSGLMFHPKVTPHLGNTVAGVGAAVAVQALAPVLRKAKLGRGVLGAARLAIAGAAALVLERELRGEDVPGANDNASGVGACLSLHRHFAEHPPENTRVIVLVTGSEESGVFGMREFIEKPDATNFEYINFDGVGADAPLRVLSKEGGPLSTLKADPGLLRAAEAVGMENADLRAEPLDDGSGLPYDATPVMAAGGKAISVVNQDGAIPNYHWPTDTFGRIAPEAFARAVRFGAAMVRRLDEDAGLPPAPDGA